MFIRTLARALRPLMAVLPIVDISQDNVCQLNKYLSHNIDFKLEQGQTPAKIRVDIEEMQRQTGAAIFKIKDFQSCCCNEEMLTSGKVEIKDGQPVKMKLNVSVGRVRLNERVVPSPDRDCDASNDVSSGEASMVKKKPVGQKRKTFGVSAKIQYVLPSLDGSFDPARGDSWSFSCRMTDESLKLALSSEYEKVDYVNAYETEITKTMKRLELTKRDTARQCVLMPSLSTVAKLLGLYV